mmetsp:Transcript_58730/g.108355  ORF Transcript_58730/g.108355 Transcript_58730/m.108355 type:complete len:764 (+) Transcript_58730:108-2399(+)
MSGAGPSTTGGANKTARAVEVLIWGVEEGLVPPPLPSPEVFRPAAPVVSLACGGGLAAFLTAERRVYLSDLRPAPASCGSPRIVEALREEDVALVACGQNHVVVITVGGAALLLTQSGGTAEATRSELLASMGSPVPLPLPLCAVRVSCGDTHVLLTTDVGVMFSYGTGSSGQLGLGANSSAPSPTRVAGLSDMQVCDVAAGSQHSCAVTTFGNIFVWGDNSHSQLGDGTILTRSSPFLLSAVDSVATVSAAAATAVLCSGGIVMAWGYPGCSTPKRAFEQTARSIAISERLLCAVTQTSELLLRAINVAGGKAFAAHQGVLSVACVHGHMAALAERAPDVAPAPPAVLLPPATPVARVSKDVERTSASANPPSVHSVASFGQLIEEVTAEHLQGTTAAAVQQQDESQRLEDLLHKQELRAELAAIRSQVRDVVQQQHQTAHRDSIASTEHPMLGLDVQVQQERLLREYTELTLQQTALQSKLAAAKAEVAESNDTLQRIEDACTYALQRTERQRAANSRSRAELSFKGGHGTVHAPTGHIHASGRLPEAVQLREDLAFLSSELKQSQEAVSRMQREVMSLRQECQHASQQVLDLEKITADAEFEAQTLAQEMQERADGVRQHLQLGVTVDAQHIAHLRQRLTLAEMQEAKYRKAIRDGAAAFSEDMKPHYAELQRLHASISRIKAGQPAGQQGIAQSIHQRSVAFQLGGDSELLQPQHAAKKTSLAATRDAAEHLQWMDSQIATIMQRTRDLQAARSTTSSH